MTNNYGGSDGGYYWANSESDSEVVVSDYVLPRFFDAFCRMRFETEEIVKDLQEVQGVENPTVDDVILEIEIRLRNLFGSKSKDFVIYDSHGEEW
jgi:hypothetical protein